MLSPCIITPDQNKQYNDSNINKTNDLMLNLTPENVTQHSRIE